MQQLVTARRGGQQPPDPGADLRWAPAPCPLSQRVSPQQGREGRTVVWLEQGRSRPKRGSSLYLPRVLGAGLPLPFRVLRPEGCGVRGSGLWGPLTTEGDQRGV